MDRLLLQNNIVGGDDALSAEFIDQLRSELRMAAVKVSLVESKIHHWLDPQYAVPLLLALSKSHIDAFEIQGQVAAGNEQRSKLVVVSNDSALQLNGALVWMSFAATGDLLQTINSSLSMSSQDSRLDLLKIVLIVGFDLLGDSHYRLLQQRLSFSESLRVAALHWVWKCLPNTLFAVPDLIVTGLGKVLTLSELRCSLLREGVQLLQKLMETPHILTVAQILTMLKSLLSALQRRIHLDGTLAKRIDVDTREVSRVFCEVF